MDVPGRRTVSGYDLDVVDHDDEGGESLPTPTAGQALTLFGTGDPVAVIESASKVASALADVIEQKQLYKTIRNRKHVYVEGWTLLGSMLGVFPVAEWTRELRDEKNTVLGWEARVEARTRSGEVVGAAEAECRFTEQKWRTSDSYAVRSMAQTRATSKALRLPLGFVMQLAGYDATPSEEMDAAVGEHEPVEDVSAREEEHRRLLVKLKDELTRLNGVPGWSKAEVREQARRSFHLRSLERFGELNNNQLQAILNAAAEVTP